MKQFLIIISLASLVSCSSKSGHRLDSSCKARVKNLDYPTTGISIRYVDTTYHVGDTTYLLTPGGTSDKFVILSK